nr:brefeldin A-inhibited guanine nucleotide-exchange protein 5 [Ipomoea batatas]
MVQTTVLLQNQGPFDIVFHKYATRIFSVLMLRFRESLKGEIGVKITS